jgi:hypothetical protein
LLGRLKLFLAEFEERCAEDGLWAVRIHSARRWGYQNLTEMNVAGRKVMVNRPMDFITRLSCWAIRLYACNKSMSRFQDRDILRQWRRTTVISLVSLE